MWEGVRVGGSEVSIGGNEGERVRVGGSEGGKQ